LDRRIAALVAAVEAGADIPELTDQLKRRAKERAGLEARLRSLPQQKALSADELDAAIKDLGGIPKVLAVADPATRHRVYESLGLRLDTITPQVASRRARWKRVSLIVSGGGLVR
jgi:hypothetical protein